MQVGAEAYGLSAPFLGALRSHELLAVVINPAVGRGGVSAALLRRDRSEAPSGLNLFLVFQPEHGIHSLVGEDGFRDVLARSGAVFVAMSRSATDQPDVVERWVFVDQVVAVMRVLLLANLGLRKGRRGKFGKALAEILAHFLYSGRRNETLLCIGIDGGTMRIDSNFEATRLDVG